MSEAALPHPDQPDANKPGGLSRRGFLGLAALGAAGLGALGLFSFRRSDDRRRNVARILGVREDSLLMPRDEDVDRLLGDR